MVRIAISVEAFDTSPAPCRSARSASSVPPTRRASAPSGWRGSGSTGSERCAGAGESYSDVILRLVESEGACAP
jgi:hypothetical protein